MELGGAAGAGGAGGQSGGCGGSTGDFQEIAARNLSHNGYPLLFVFALCVDSFTVTENKNSRPHRPSKPARTGAECFRGTTLFYRSLAGRGLDAAAENPLRTAGRCNGRTRRRLGALAPRPRSSETIFSPLFPACFHRPGSLEGVNARAYSSLHSQFDDIVLIVSTRRDFVNRQSEFFDL